MLNKMLRIIATFFAVFAFGITTAQATYVVGGPSGAQQSSGIHGSYQWDGGANIAPLRNALEDPNNFGPAGTVNEVISTVNVDLSTDDMSGLDGFIVPWWYFSESAPYEQKIVDFFMAGGDLWLMQDHSSYDGVGEKLGIPTIGQTNITPVSGTAPLFDGPFGIAVTVNQGGGHEGYISEADVLGFNGTIVGRNTDDQVIAAVWKPGQFAPGAGSLIVVSDIDMFTTMANFNTMNDNAIFALNSFAFLATSQAVPEPGALALLGFGLVGIAFYRRR